MGAGDAGEPLLANSGPLGPARLTQLVMPGDQREFTYTNAEVHPRIGDQARFVDRPGEVLIVEDVIDCEGKQELWGWEGDEFGIVLNGGEGYGLVATQHVSTEVELISRNEQTA